MSNKDKDLPTPDDEAAASEEEIPNRGFLFDEATREAERYKWIESEKAGRDLGDSALRDWHKNYWRSWCRERWIEHLHGERFWIELDHNDYGLLNQQFHDNLEIAEKIIDRIKEGGENLDIIQWASEHRYDIGTVIDVLNILDINSRRLIPPNDFFVDEPPPAEEEPEHNVPGKAKRILVVDDDEDTCMLLKELFQQHELECTICSSGEAAIKELEQRRFHCYLIDIMLPGKHGAEIAWYLRRHGITAPVIAISAVLEKWNEDDLYDCGFTGLIAKPFDLKALHELAEEVRQATASVPTPTPANQRGA